VRETLGTLLIVGIPAVVLWIVLDHVVEPPTTIAHAPIAATKTTTTTTKATAPKEDVIRLSFGELTSNSKQYEGKRVTVNEGLILWSVQSYNEWSSSFLEPGYPSGENPFNPRCEYIVSLQVLSASSPVIWGCVPRPKIESLAGAWAGESHVRFVGVVAPKQDEPRGWVFMRDMQIITPRQNTSEKWPDEH